MLDQKVVFYAKMLHFTLYLKISWVSSTYACIRIINVLHTFPLCISEFYSSFWCLTIFFLFLGKVMPLNHRLHLFLHHYWMDWKNFTSRRYLILILAIQKIHILNSFVCFTESSFSMDDSLIAMVCRWTKMHVFCNPKCSYFKWKNVFNISF